MNFAQRHIPKTCQPYQNSLVYAHSHAEWTPTTTAVAIHKIHNLLPTFLAASCQFLRLLALCICRGREWLYYFKVALIAEDVIASNSSMFLTHIVFEIVQQMLGHGWLELQVLGLGCMCFGQGLTLLCSQL
jgi:hypothetical protein